MAGAIKSAKGADPKVTTGEYCTITTGFCPAKMQKYHFKRKHSEKKH